MRVAGERVADGRRVALAHAPAWRAARELTLVADRRGRAGRRLRARSPADRSGSPSPLPGPAAAVDGLAATAARARASSSPPGSPTRRRAAGRSPAGRVRLVAGRGRPRTSPSCAASTSSWPATAIRGSRPSDPRLIAIAGERAAWNGRVARQLGARHALRSPDRRTAAAGRGRLCRPRRRPRPVRAPRPRRASAPGRPRVTATGRRGLAIIGGGKIGEALLSGLVRRGGPDGILVCERSPERAAQLAERYGVPAVDLAERRGPRAGAAARGQAAGHRRAARPAGRRGRRRGTSWCRSPPACPRRGSRRRCPPASPSSGSCPTPRRWSTRA